MTSFIFSHNLARRMAAIPVVAAWSLIVIGVISLPGCGAGGNGPQFGKVTGVVTLDGNPLPEAQVEFLPQLGRSSTAETGKDGSYRLQYTADREGAVVGSHTVKIHTAVDGRVGGPKELLPARYHSETELKAEVKSGNNTLNFDLKSE